MNETINIFVGTDRSQLLAVKVLEHSIKRHTTSKVIVHPMLDLPVPTPVDPRNWKRTGFSFSRFCIPKLMNYKGKAIYMDADMLVFKDIKDLYNIPFEGNEKVLMQDDLPENEKRDSKHGAPSKRIKQSAVMVIDCEKANWEVNEIIKGLDDGIYNYEELMMHFCILNNDEIGFKVPFEWNSIEYWDKNTCNIHYSDMTTQPWVSPHNKLDQLWYDEVRLMLSNKQLKIEELEKEIELGYFRPSLKNDILRPPILNKLFRRLIEQKSSFRDSKLGYQKHEEVYRLKKERLEATKKFAT